MSETGEKPEANNESDEKPETGDDAEFPVEESSAPDDTAEISVAPKARRFSPVAWLALLVAFAAAAGVGWLWKTGQDAPQTEPVSQSSVDQLSRSLSSAEETVAALQRRMASLAEAQSSRGADIASLEREMQLGLEELGSVPGRLSNLEGSLSSLQGISSGVRDTWLIAEAEYYLQIANAQLQLAGNPHLASLALRLADEKVLSLANPALTGVRRAIAAELRALDGMEKPDIEGITLTLSSLASVVDTLPLKTETGSGNTGDAGVDPELSGMDRALASLKGAVGSVVSVRQIDEAERPFVAPEAEYFLRANLSLQLQAARLALLRGEKAVFEQSIVDATSWLNDYYDADSAAVQSALRTFDEIRSSSIATSAPDISESLRLLRQFNTLSEYESMPADPAPAEMERTPESEPDSDSATDPEIGT